MNPPIGSDRSVGIGRFGVHALLAFTSICTLVLIFSGGLVTSKGVGMTVPDWPTSYGYNMFLFPVSRWVGGIFYEHTHRLIASGVGLLTMIAAIWLLVAEPRRWVKILGGAAFVAVVIQGILGGFRVTLFKDEIGIFHGMLAQAFLSTLVILTVVTAPAYIRGSFQRGFSSRRFRWSVLGLTALIFAQLGIAATMRHAHANLSITDFPLAYGQVWPDTSEEALLKINEERRLAEMPPTTRGLILLQMLHRVVAYGILLWVAILFGRSLHGRTDLATSKACGVWLGVITVQAALGAWTIWSGKAADVATAHVAVGAFCLVIGVVITYRLFVSFYQRKAELALAVSPTEKQVLV
jgi:cytochrome c oxidase assembly protein subunit 15